MHHNLNDKQKLALKQLKENSNIVIKPADKGVVIVVMNKDMYLSKMHTMLDDPSTYESIPSDDTHNVKRKADEILHKLLSDNKISKKQHRYLTEFPPKCPLIYGLPKMHKADIPFRPIVSQVNGPTCKINALLDKYLETAESNIPYLLRDTNQFLKVVNNYNNVDNITYLVTLDVTSLYTNIPQQEAILWVSEWYESNYNYNPHLPDVDKETIKQLLEFVLYNTQFQFLNKHYKQKHGTSMGASSSVKLANIYMYKWFQKYLKLYDKTIPNAIYRFIDDCFFFWTHSLEELTDFYNYINHCHPTIKFEINYSNTTINFLDTTIYINNSILYTTIYKKPTDRKQFLNYTSNHPKHVKDAIPYSQALRYRRIISDNNKLTEELNLLTDKFLRAGFPEKLLTEQISRIKNINRNQILDKTTTTTAFKMSLPLIINYHCNIDPHIIKSTIQQSGINSLVLTQISLKNSNRKKIQLIYKRNTTLSNVLTRNSLITDPINILTDLDGNQTQTININNGTTPCGHPRCLCCQSIDTKNTYTDYNNTHTYPINNKFNCNSNNVIYMISCTRCYKNYIGITERKLKDRLNNHRHTIKNKYQTAIGIHFNTPGHNSKHLKIKVITTLDNLNYSEKLSKEKELINKIKSYYPYGLNHYPINK